MEGGSHVMRRQCVPLFIAGAPSDNAGCALFKRASSSGSLKCCLSSCSEGEGEAAEREQPREGGFGTR